MVVIATVVLLVVIAAVAVGIYYANKNYTDSQRSTPDTFPPVQCPVGLAQKGDLCVADGWMSWITGFSTPTTVIGFDAQNVPILATKITADGVVTANAPVFDRALLCFEMSVKDQSETLSLSLSGNDGATYVPAATFFVTNNSPDGTPYLVMTGATAVGTDQDVFIIPVTSATKTFQIEFEQFPTDATEGQDVSLQGAYFTQRAYTATRMSVIVNGVRTFSFGITNRTGVAYLAPLKMQLTATNLNGGEIMVYGLSQQTLVVPSGSAVPPVPALVTSSQVPNDSPQAAAIAADQGAPMANTNDPGLGWYFTNDNAPNNKINWYFVGDTPTRTLAGLVTLSAEVKLYKQATLSVLPYITIYTKPEGDGDEAAWYRSRQNWLFSAADQMTLASLTNPTAVMLFGADPLDFAPGVTRYSLVKDTNSSVGPQTDSEQILLIALSTSSNLPDGDVEFALTKFLSVANGVTVLIETTSQ